MTAAKRLNLFFVIIMSLVSCICFSQTADRRYIDSVLKKKDPAFKLGQRVIYVVNGVPYDTLALDSVLAHYEVNLLLDVTYWDGKKNGHYPFYSDAAIIVFAEPQSKKSKRYAWKSAKKFVNDNSFRTALYIDNMEINQSLINSTLQRIRLVHIMYIDAIQFKDQRRIRIWTRQ
jgi:hypothetical protein